MSYWGLEQDRYYLQEALKQTREYLTVVQGQRDEARNRLRELEHEHERMKQMFRNAIMELKADRDRQKHTLKRLSRELKQSQNICSVLQAEKETLKRKSSSSSQLMPTEGCTSIIASLSNYTEHIYVNVHSPIPFLQRQATYRQRHIHMHLAHNRLMNHSSRERHTHSHYPQVRPRIQRCSERYACKNEQKECEPVYVNLPQSFPQVPAQKSHQTVEVHPMLTSNSYCNSNPTALEKREESCSQSVEEPIYVNQQFLKYLTKCRQRARVRYAPREHSQPEEKQTPFLPLHGPGILSEIKYPPVLMMRTIHFESGNVTVVPSQASNNPKSTPQELIL